MSSSLLLLDSFVPWFSFVCCSLEEMTLLSSSLLFSFSFWPSGPLSQKWFFSFSSRRLPFLFSFRKELSKRIFSFYHSFVRACIHCFVFPFMLLFSLFEMHENEASMKQAGLSFSSEIEKSSFGKRWPRRNIPPVSTPMAMFDQLSTSLEAAWTKLRKEGTILNQNL